MRKKGKSKKLSKREMIFSPVPASWFWGVFTILVATMIIGMSDTLMGLYVGVVVFCFGGFLMFTMGTRMGYLFFVVFFAAFATLPVPHFMTFNIPTMFFLVLIVLVRNKKIKARWLERMSRWPK